MTAIRACALSIGAAFVLVWVLLLFSFNVSPETGDSRPQPQSVQSSTLKEQSVPAQRCEPPRPFYTAFTQNENDTFSLSEQGTGDYTTTRWIVKCEENKNDQAVGPPSTKRSSFTFTTKRPSVRHPPHNLTSLPSPPPPNAISCANVVAAALCAARADPATQRDHNPLAHSPLDTAITASHNDHLFRTALLRLRVRDPKSPIRTTIKSTHPRVAFFMLMHRDAIKAMRTIARLNGTTTSHTRHTFIVHVDAFAASHVVRRMEEFARTHTNVRLTHTRFFCYWGGISLVYAEYVALLEAVVSGLDFDYWINLSESDVPLQTDDGLATVLNSLDGMSVIEMLPNALRVIRAHEVYIECGEQIHKVASVSRNEEEGQAAMPRSCHPILAAYKVSKLEIPIGSQWHVLSRELAYQAASSTAFQELIAMFHNNFLCDETVWQAGLHLGILNDSHGVRTEAALTGNYRPSELSCDICEKLHDEGKLFARKLPHGDHESVLERCCVEMARD